MLRIKNPKNKAICKYVAYKTMADLIGKSYAKGVLLDLLGIKVHKVPDGQKYYKEGNTNNCIECTEEDIFGKKAKE